MQNEPHKIQRRSYLHTFLWGLHVDVIMQETSPDPITFYKVNSASPTKEQIQKSNGKDERQNQNPTQQKFRVKTKNFFNGSVSLPSETAKSVIRKPNLE